MSETFNFERYIELSQTPNTICNPLHVPIGVNSTGILEYVDLGDDYRHNILVSGQCGSGKSMFLQSLICSAMLSYTPDSLNIWLYDGTLCEYRHYSTEAHPHITHIGGGEECEMFLAALEKELERRTQIYIDAQAQSYRHYIKEHACIPFPRLLVVMDDFDYYLRILLDQKPENCYRMCNLLRMASTFGISFAVNVQSAERIPELLLSMFAVRIALPHYPTFFKSLFDNQDVAAFAQDLHTGEAVVNTPYLHKVKLLYLSSDAFSMITSASAASVDRLLQ